MKTELYNADGSFTKRLERMIRLVTHDYNHLVEIGVYDDISKFDMVKIAKSEMRALSHKPRIEKKKAKKAEQAAIDALM